MIANRKYTREEKNQMIGPIIIKLENRLIKIKELMTPLRAQAD